MFITGMLLSRVRSAAEGPEFRLGSLGMDYDGKIYKYLKYKEGTGTLDIVAGDVCFYVSETGHKGNEVTADQSDGVGQEVGAGVACGAHTATGSFGWFQIKGQATLAVALGGSAGDGDALTCVGAADKAVTKAAEADSAAVYKPVIGFADDASAKTIMCDFPF